jgi:hypothetical protein
MVTKGNKQFWDVHPKVSEDPEEFSGDFRGLFMTMCNEDPKVRPTLEEVKMSAWFNGPTYTNEKAAQKMQSIVQQIRGEKKQNHQ